MGKARLASSVAGASSVFLLLSLISPFAFADAASVAETWIKENMPRVSERLCREKARASVFDFYLKFYNELWADAKELRGLRADALSVEEELIEKSFHLKKEEQDAQARILSVLEAQKQILKSVERGGIVLQKIDYFIDRFKSLPERFFAAEKEDLTTLHRAELHPDGILEDVSDWDGLYFSGSTEEGLVGIIISLAKGAFNTAKNYHRNRKINQKLQKVRDQFYHLQTPQAKFLEVVDSEFLNKKEGFEKGLKEIGEKAIESQRRLIKTLTTALNRFVALDNLRGELLQTFRSEETGRKLAGLKKELRRLEIERFEAILRARLAVVEFEEILEWGKEKREKK